ncbi:Arm DNA-binding domain-containing protein [Comamonas sp. GB3 AK4-5]|uniref:Arm DNA-binding domain-containing protein n=1 Tax=Comamonas sp. GB3 AK4-5 TaxID=3231487 RepID=UPI00351EE0A8
MLSVVRVEREQARFTDPDGLYLQVSPKGSKRWFSKYRAEGKEKQLAQGCSLGRRPVFNQY